jgi:choice-of-anchor C domain-containing protein
MKIPRTNEANHKANDQPWQKKSEIRLLILVAVILLAGTSSARAQTTVELPKLVLEAKHTEYVNTGNPDTPEVTGVKSSNPSVARASVYRVTRVQIVAVAPGKTTVEFWDHAAQIRYTVPVWVTASNATGGGGQGFNPQLTQLDQIVMLVKRTQNVAVPGTGTPRISGVKSSNPSVATARKNTVGTIQIYSIALGDTFIEFTDNATGTTYQVHVYVRDTLSGPNGGGGAGGGGGSGVEQPDRAPGLGTQDTDLFNNFNTGGTVNGPRRPTVFTLNRPARITELVTYHWNSGGGAKPGTISLRDQNGKIYGPFAATGSSGQGGAADVNWVAKANVTVPAGTYTLLDSNPRTWSNNSQSGFAGFAKVRGYLLQSPVSLPKPIARPETQTNLIQNGSFEVGPDPGPLGTYSAGATSIPGWRVTTRTIDYIGSYWPASHGKRSVDLDGTPGAGGIAQSFATIPRQEYVVTFDLAGNPELPPPVKKLQVNAAGQSAEFSFDISGKSKSGMGWQRKTWRFIANETTTTIEFLSLGDAASSGGPVIDNIWVVAAKPL